MNLRKSKITKKIFTSILPFAFLFAAMLPVNVAYAAAPTTVSVLPEAADGSLTAITNGQSRNYATATGYKDSAGNVGAGRGTITYSTAGGTGVLTLNGVDLTTANGLLTADAGNGDLEVVLEGTNSITSTADSIVATSNNIRFTGSGTLTISQNTAGSAISSATAGNIEFASTSDITLNQAAADPAIDSAGDIIMTSGNVRVIETGAANAVNAAGKVTVDDGTLDITQNTANNALNVAGTLDMTNGTLTTKNTAATGNGINTTGAINITGGTVDASMTGATATGIPMYSANAITISSANVKAMAAPGSSTYGISNAAGHNITINKGSIVEAVGNSNAINPARLVIDDTVAWVAMAGQSAQSATRLTETKGSDIVTVLKNSGHDYVKLYNETTIDPTSSTFDKNTSSKEHTEITVALNLNGNALTEITNADGTALTVGKDYVLNYNGTDPVSVTFQVREYLETLPVGTHVLTFKFDNGTNIEFTLNVVDTTAEVKKDEVPKTGDNSTIMPYVLLLTAGIFTIVVATKKKIFNR